MKSTALAVRASGALLARRLYWPIVFGALAISLVLLGIVIWLSTLSAWWWLLLLPIMVVVSVAAVLLIVAKLLINYVTPAQNSTQKAAAKQFVDRLQASAELAGTPKFILLFRVIRNIAAPSQPGLIGQVSDHSSGLKNDFLALEKLFRG